MCSQGTPKVCCNSKTNELANALTDVIFETGAYGVPSKLRNPTVLGQGGPSKGQTKSK